jgi:hypothetical protein
MNLLAIDPGPTQSAYVIWDGKKILDKRIEMNLPLLCYLRNPSVYWDAATWPEALVIEQIKSYGMSVSDTIFETVYWTGRFREAWGTQGFFDRYPRMTIKMHLCHNSRAKDGNIRQALIDRLGGPGTKKQPGATYGCSKDIWAALALAITAFDCGTIGSI